MATFAIQAVDSIVQLPITADEKLVKIQRCINLLQRLQHEVTTDLNNGGIRETYRPVAQQIINKSQKIRRYHATKAH